MTVADKVLMRTPVSYAIKSALTELLWYVEPGEMLRISAIHPGTLSTRPVQVTFCAYYPRAIS